MRRWLMFLMLAIIFGFLNASGQTGKPEAPKGDKAKPAAPKDDKVKPPAPKGDKAKPAAPKQAGWLDPKTADIWKGDNPKPEQVAKMEQEELKERICMKQLETLRGLRFKELVKSKALSREQFARTFGRGDVNMPMGIYRYEDKTLYLNLSSDSKKLETLRIHETVLALQHQLWGLESPGTLEEKNLFQWMKEGEATAVVWALYPKTREIQNAPGKAVPQEQEAFNYTAAAAKFIDELAAKEGWSAVDKLFKEISGLSTEMILHPEKYLDKNKRDEPTALNFPDIAKAMGANWQINLERLPNMSYNTFGEFEMRRLFLACDETSSDAEQIAAGWDGDWRVIISDVNDKGKEKERCEIFLTAWDSNKDAVEWADAYTKLFIKQILPKYTDRAELKKADIPKDIKPVLEKLGKDKSEVRYYTYEGGRVYVEINGPFAIFVECTNVATLQKILEPIAKDVTIKEKK